MSSSPRFSYATGSHLIAANHSSGLDPFVIVASLRYRDFFRLAPFSFMTANKFMEPWWLRPFAWAAGCFPAYPGLGAYGIDKAVSDLDHGYTLVIFPEGRRAKGSRPEPKRGVEIILRRSPGTRLVMARIEWQSKIAVRSIRMAYPAGQSVPKTSKAIVDAIYTL